jgi:trans-aconitate 2-methyltransferase
VPWDPDRYLRFADHRARPGLELMARIPDIDARAIVDLGSGTGQLAARLAERWPAASVRGVDSSAEMVERARVDHPAIDWTVGDIAAWQPSEPVDLLFSNAALHWLDGHDTLFRRLRSFLAPGGVLAVQMPDNWAAPTHRIPAGVLDEGQWPAAAREALLRDRLADPGDYASWLAPAGVDLWRTTYYQRLTGDDPVWTWVTGSVLGPVLAALDEPDRERFGGVCRARYRLAYPAGPDGVTTLPFSRLFLVAIAMEQSGESGGVEGGEQG